MRAGAGFDFGFISIHALRKESDMIHRTTVSFGLISIHALRKESDKRRGCTRPAIGMISIHALRKESDRMGASQVPRTAYFNPRSP